MNTDLSSTDKITELRSRIESIDNKINKLENYIKVVFISIFIFLIFFSALTFREIYSVEKRIRISTDLTDLFNNAGVGISWEN